MENSRKSTWKSSNGGRDDDEMVLLLAACCCLLLLPSAAAAATDRVAEFGGAAKQQHHHYNAAQEQNGSFFQACSWRAAEASARRRATDAVESARRSRVAQHPVNLLLERKFAAQSPQVQQSRNFSLPPIPKTRHSVHFRGAHACPRPQQLQARRRAAAEARPIFG